MKTGIIVSVLVANDCPFDGRAIHGRPVSAVRVRSFDDLHVYSTLA